MIEIYCVSRKTGNVLSSSLYSETDLREIFGKRTAKWLKSGAKSFSRQKSQLKFYRQKASTFNKENPGAA